MPELPEVEILVRHLAPLLRDRTIHGVTVRRSRVIRPTGEAEFRGAVTGARILDVQRRAKYLIFTFQGGRAGTASRILGHLGMTGRMYLAPKGQPIPKHAAVILDLGDIEFIFEDTRYFGRLTLDTVALDTLGPEPLEGGFSDEYFQAQLIRSTQAIKVKLLDQTLIAGLGNIYAGEALFRARIPPRLPARKLTCEQTKCLLGAIREVLREAIERGSSLALDFQGQGNRDRIFYYGRSEDARLPFEERFRVYDRAGKPCVVCGTPIKRIVQAARSTYYCPRCQAGAGTSKTRSK